LDHNPQCPNYDSETTVVCDQGHWLTLALRSDRCPVILHEADADGRCVGTMDLAICRCDDLARAEYEAAYEADQEHRGDEMRDEGL